MTAADIMARMATAYAAFQTYRDTGQDATRFFPAGGRPYTTIRPFRTAFARPDRFRFEFRDRL